jgi:hypothetical protein
LKIDLITIKKKTLINSHKSNLRKKELGQFSQVLKKIEIGDSHKKERTAQH